MIIDGCESVPLTYQRMAGYPRQKIQDKNAESPQGCRTIVMEPLLRSNESGMYVIDRTSAIPVSNELGLVAGVRYAFRINRNGNIKYAEVVGPDTKDAESVRFWKAHKSPIKHM